MNREQCKGCAYFAAGAGGTKAHVTERFCHYMLYTGKRREVGENEKCLSRAKTAQKKTSAFEIPIAQT